MIFKARALPFGLSAGRLRRRRDRPAGDRRRANTGADRSEEFAPSKFLPVAAVIVVSPGR